MKISIENLLIILTELVGETNVLTYSKEVAHYGSDQTMDLNFSFDILIKPKTPQEISSIYKICTNYDVPVTPRGGGSGVTGGALPVLGGVVLSTERLNKIITVNRIDRFVVAESGVVTGDLMAEVKTNGLFLPVAPTSNAFSFIGGNVAVNSGGISSCKYGTISNYVLNLEVVLPSGEIMWTGSNVQKNATGFDLKHLFIGSEGVLGVITKVVIKLLPIVPLEYVLLSQFDKVENAINLLIELKESGFIPTAAEIIGKRALNITSNYLNNSYYQIKDNVGAHLILAFEGYEVSALEKTLDAANQIIEKYTNEQVIVASSSHEKEKLWHLRKNIGNAITSDNYYYRDIDVCVPLSNLPEYITKIEEISPKINADIVYFGHAYDGNLHSMVVFNNNACPQDRLAIDAAITEIYSFAVQLGGVISGEHGMGFLQKDYMQFQFNNSQINLMKKIKKIFDPNNISNPGKFI